MLGMYSQIGKAISQLLKNAELLKSGKKLARPGEFKELGQVALKLAHSSKQQTAWLWKIFRTFMGK